jgi:hypothetical protein
MKKLVPFLVAVTGIVAATSVVANELNHGAELQYRPTGKGVGEVVPEQERVHNNAGGPPKSSNGISYHGGPVMTNSLGANLYYIWYGDWSAAIDTAAKPIIRTFGQTVGGTPIFNTNVTYTDSANRAIVNRVNPPVEYIDPSSSNSLSDANVASIVVNAIKNGFGGTADPNGVYFVLTGPNVQETSGFGSKYCGWHTYQTVGGVAVKYSFVGNARIIAPSGCLAQSTASPNNNPGADGMVSVMFHELSEAMSDPQLNAWYDSRGYENADKCAWTWGTTTTLANGSKANVTFGGTSWLIQQNWVNASGGYCSVKYP